MSAKADVENVMQFFGYTHLPEKLQEVSKEFYNLAKKMEGKRPEHPEMAVALRKLLEAKDAAVRAVLTDD